MTPSLTMIIAQKLLERQEARRNEGVTLITYDLHPKVSEGKEWNNIYGDANAIVIDAILALGGEPIEGVNTTYVFDRLIDNAEADRIFDKILRTDYNFALARIKENDLYIK